MRIDNLLDLLRFGVEASYRDGLASKSFPAWSVAACWSLARQQVANKSAQWRAMAALMTKTLGYPDYDTVFAQLLPDEQALVEAANPVGDDWPELESDPAAEVSLANAQGAALRAVDRLAEGARARVVTTNAAKIATYALKRELALAAVGGDADAEALFADEAAAREMTAAELTALVAIKAEAWTSAAFAIDAAAAEAKVAVSAAEDVGVVSASINALNAALEAAVGDIA